MPKKQRRSHLRALPPATAPPAAHHKPATETVVIHTTRTRKRDASGGSLAGKAGPVLPILGGIAGGAATVFATSKLNAHPVAIAAGAAIGGMALAAASKTPWIKQAAMGAAIGAGTLGGVTLVGHMLAPKPAAASSPPPKKRGADGERDADGAADGFVTRTELNDALSKLADSHKETQKQQTCDLLTALRDEIKKVIAEGPNGPGVPTTSPPPPPPKPSTSMPMRFTYPYTPPRSAEGDEYHRNAYGEDLRDAIAYDEYTRNAYGEDLRDAVGYEERDAAVYDERDAGLYDERDAAGYDERDAAGYEERDAVAYEERDAPAYEERDAAPYEERDAGGGEFDWERGVM